MENRITQAARFVKWWAGLPPGKKLVTYLLSGIIAVFLVSTVVVKILYKQTIADREETKRQLKDCKDDNQRLQDESKEDNQRLQAEKAKVEEDFRNYLIESNKEKESRIREKDSIMKMVQATKKR